MESRSLLVNSPKFGFLSCKFLLISLSFIGTANASEMDALLDMPLLDLLNIEVTSVSRREQKIHTAPAAIYVVSSNDLQRLGITSIPDALRMVPGIHVASIDGNKWSISSRGFGMRYGNKLLVQIDGRSVYSPSYSGVYWDIQDVPISTIERIEVVRGPGATLWGANAVNGVINIITKTASETQGGLLEVATGNQLEGFGHLRYGGKLDEEIYGRIYAQSKSYNSNDLLSDGSDANDDWTVSTAGFRIDNESAAVDQWTLQGDLTQANENQKISTLFSAASFPGAELGIDDDVDYTGGNLLARHSHTFDNQSSSSLQLYWDYTDRDELYLQQKHNTYSLDFQHQLMPMHNNAVIWGLGYRYIDANYGGSYALSIETEVQTELYSAFIQDEITLSPDKLALTLGSKFEHNDITGFEVQPSARLMWQPTSGHNFWGSISRAVRTPSHIEDSGELITGLDISTGIPLPMVLYGNSELESEELIAYELGYRYYSHPQFTLDGTLFYNVYDNYLSFERVSSDSIYIDNKIYGYTYGGELAAVWQAKPWWQLKGSYSSIHLNMEADPDSLDISTLRVINNSSPEQMWKLHSAMDLGKAWTLDAWVYYVGEVSDPSNAYSSASVDSYTSANLRVSWQVNPELRLSVTGNNINDDKHIEYISELYSSSTEIERSITANLEWKF